MIGLRMRTLGLRLVIRLVQQLTDLNGDFALFIEVVVPSDSNVCVPQLAARGEDSGLFADQGAEFFPQGVDGLVGCDSFAPQPYDQFLEFAVAAVVPVPGLCS